MSARSRHARVKAVGNDPPFGACCAIPRIGERSCYGKTEQRPRQRVTRPLRQRKALPSRDVGGHERPRAEWVEVPVPALVSEDMFALAQEQLEKNKHHSPPTALAPGRTCLRSPKLA